MFYRVSSIVHLICVFVAIVFAMIALDFNSPLFEKLGFTDTMFQANDGKNLCTLDSFMLGSRKYGSYHVIIFGVISIGFIHLIEFFLQFALSLSFSHFADIPRGNYCDPTWKTKIVGFICKVFPGIAKFFMIIRLILIFVLFSSVGVVGVCKYRWADIEDNQIKNCRAWSTTCLPNDVNGPRVSADNRMLSCQLKPEYFCHFPMQPIVDGAPTRWVTKSSPGTEPQIIALEYLSGRLCDITHRDSQRSLSDSPHLVRFIKDEATFERDVVRYHGLDIKYNKPTQKGTSFDSNALGDVPLSSASSATPSRRRLMNTQENLNELRNVNSAGEIERVHYNFGMILLTTGDEMTAKEVLEMDETDNLSTSIFSIDDADGGNKEAADSIVPHSIIAPPRCDFMDFPRGSIVEAFIPNYLNPYHRPRCYLPDFRKRLRSEYPDIETAADISNSEDYSIRPRGFTKREVADPWRTPDAVKNMMPPGVSIMTDQILSSIQSRIDDSSSAFVEIDENELYFQHDSNSLSFIASSNFPDNSLLQIQRRKLNANTPSENEAVSPSPLSSSPSEAGSSKHGGTETDPKSANSADPLAGSLAKVLSEVIQKEVQKVVNKESPSNEEPQAHKPTTLSNEFVESPDADLIRNEDVSNECQNTKANTPQIHMIGERSIRHAVKVTAGMAYKSCEEATETSFSFQFPPLSTCPFSEFVDGRSDLKETPNFSANNANLRLMRRARSSTFSKSIFIFGVLALLVFLAQRGISELIHRWVKEETCFKNPGKRGSQSDGEDGDGILKVIWKVLAGYGP